MGIINHGDLLKSRYPIIALIFGYGAVRKVQIKHRIGHIFLTKIDNMLLAFTMENAEELEYEAGSKKSMTVIKYDIGSCISDQSWFDNLRDMGIQGGVLDEDAAEIIQILADVETNETNVKERDMVAVEQYVEDKITSFAAMEDPTAHAYVERYGDLKKKISQLPPDCLPVSARELDRGIKECITAPIIDMQSPADTTFNLRDSKPDNPMKHINRPMNAILPYAKLIGISLLVFGGIWTTIEYELIYMVVDKPQVERDVGPVILCDDDSIIQRYNGTDDPVKAYAVAHLLGNDPCTPSQHWHEMFWELDRHTMRNDLLRTGQVASNLVDSKLDNFYAGLTP